MTLKKKSQSDLEWLQSQPNDDEICDSPLGGKHIPIEKLRPLLDQLNACTKNYVISYYKNGYGDLSAAGQIELTVTVDGVDRTVTGASNLCIKDAINDRWNGSLKSDCVKNAAIELGIRFGRELNKDMPELQEPKPIKMAMERAKRKPDSKVMQQFLKAVERGETETITLLTNMYDIKTEQNV